ncbi:MAG: glycerophosphodiester phosphodiesterase [Oleibacter sp.]|nr:glycerophosphodiester phosphodiesterase [Thalassolituus sp.]
MKKPLTRLFTTLLLTAAGAAACAGFNPQNEPQASHKADRHADQRDNPHSNYGWHQGYGHEGHEKNGKDRGRWDHGRQKAVGIELGPRPQFLVNDMDEGPLKQRLSRCENKPQKRSTFSIGHRGAPLMFPEHTREGYIAAAKMGAGIVECDVTFTKDEELVCRHSQCDLHTTTNILATPLAAKCSVPPQFSVDGELTNASDIRCCTSDITLAEFKTLQGKMDAADTSATTIEGYMNATADYRTDLYATRGTLMSHKESIELFNQLGVNFTPELKSPQVAMPFNGHYSQQDYAQQMIDEYREAGIHPSRVWAQSFNYDDILYWVNNEPAFGRQAAYLLQDGLESTTLADMNQWYQQGVRVIAPATFMLVDVDAYGQMVASDYALNARAAGLKMIAWTLERSGPLTQGGGWYYQTVNGLTGGQNIINNDGDMYTLIDVLAQDVGVVGIFSDWPATVTYYANCSGK